MTQAPSWQPGCWHPIDKDPPCDGSTVLLFVPDRDPQVIPGYFHHEVTFVNGCQSDVKDYWMALRGWHRWRKEDQRVKPTHYMLMPEPPLKLVSTIDFDHLARVQELLSERAT